MKALKNLTLAITLLTVMSCQAESTKENSVSKNESISNFDAQKLDTATFAGGCFWCVEASFEQIKGVVSAVSGYAGGSKANADYKLVSSGRTKHAEAVQVYFDPEIIDYKTLLDIFFVAHDAKQLNRQGPDVGPQYRSAIFYHNEQQKQLSESKITEIQPSYGGKIVTQINPFTEFFLAENYHQDYEKNHPFNPYIMNVSRPKIEKVKAEFSELLKDE